MTLSAEKTPQILTHYSEGLSQNNYQRQIYPRKGTSECRQGVRCENQCMSVTGASPRNAWGGVLPVASGLEYSNLQRECTEFPYAVLLLVGTAIVQKEESFVECTKPPVLRQAKPGA